MAEKRLWFDIFARTRSAKASIEELAGEFDQLAVSADGANSGVGDLSDRTDDLGKSADTTTGKVKGLAKSTSHLDSEITKTRTNLVELIKKFDETGDTTLFKEIGSEKRSLGKLTRLKKTLSDMADDAQDAGHQAGRAVGQSVMEGFGAIFQAVPPEVKAGLLVLAGTVAMVALPALGSMIGAAVVGAVGLGGVVGGIFAATKDSRVQAAGAELGKNLSASVGVIGQPFVEPLLSSMDLIKSRASVLFGNLGHALQPLADEVRPLTEGLLGFVDRMTPGLARMSQAVKPILTVFTDALPVIGKDIGDMLAKIADNDGAVLGMKSLLKTIDGLVVMTGNFFSNLETIYTWGYKVDQWSNGFMEKVTTFTPILHEMFAAVNAGGKDAVYSIGAAKFGADTAAQSVTALGRSAEQAANDFKDLKKAIDDAFGIQMSLDEANLHYEQGLISLKKELIDGERTLAVNTEAGQSNRAAVLDQIQAIQQLRDANLDNGMALATADDMYRQQLDTLRKMLLQLGFNKQAVEQIIGAYKGVPARVETEIAMKFSLEGALAGAKLTGGTSSAQLWSLFRSLSGKDLEGRAAGGSTRRGRTYLVGENGPELWSEDSDGHMTNARGTAALMGSGPSLPVSGWGEQQSPTFNLIFPTTGIPLLDALIFELRKHIRIEGGNVQTVLGTS